MTQLVRRKRSRARVNALGALLIALAIAALAVWLLFLPIAQPMRLTPLEPRPLLLDKPHRQTVAGQPGIESPAH